MRLRKSRPQSKQLVNDRMCGTTEAKGPEGTVRLRTAAKSSDAVQRSELQNEC